MGKVTVQSVHTFENLKIWSMPGHTGFIPLCDCLWLLAILARSKNINTEITKRFYVALDSGEISAFVSRLSDFAASIFC